MKKILIILMSLVIISCGNNVNNLVENEEVENTEEVVEYIDTIKVEEINIFKGNGALTEIVKIEKVNNSICIVKYSSEDKILHLIYNGNEYKRYGVLFNYKKDNIRNGYKCDNIYFDAPDDMGFNIVLIINKYETHNEINYHI